jgi:hypothetical protein
MKPVAGFGVGDLAVSADGSTVVGGTPGSDTEAALWTEQDGLVRLGIPIGADESQAAYASADGSAVAVRAWENDPNNPSGTAIRTSATLWTETEGLRDLGQLPAGWQSTHPRGISDDGDVLLGTGGPGRGISVPFLWSRDAGITPLQTLEGIGNYGEVFPLMMTGDASIVLGNYLGGVSPTVPFVWDARHGTRDLGQVLVEDHGLKEVFFDNVRAISPDSTALVVRKGRANENQMWLLILDKPLVTATPEPANLLMTLFGVSILAARRKW